MTPWHVVLYTAMTVIIIIIAIIGVYFFRTKSVMKKTENRSGTLIDTLKPGDQVLFANGLIGQFVRVKDKDVSAIIKLHDGSEIEVALYSINNIIN
ncbi:preprotein translocase subunit YajC [Erysipelothrix urinaevulpis]|uniref:preprotein translocase subunit YajC n=1 Tax=Erysipelothrix urinaevulpis TaxID=2683717 RepID=UPI00135B547B|nr:preprotein translocase subunit YajC [Erysipelothrix urinaevulpis]